MGVLGNNALVGASAAGAAGGGNFYTHQIPNSVRMVAPSSTSSNNSRLTKTFSTVDSNVHFTLNFWIKRSAIEGKNPVSSARPLTLFTPRSGTSGSVLQEFQFGATGSYGAGDAFVITNTNSGTYILSTNNLFRDTSAWYNIHIQADLDNASASEKLKIFVNGTEASYNVDNRSSYTSLAGVVAGAWTIGDYYNYGYPIQSYLAQWCYIDGTTYAPTDFAEMSNGVWIPKDVTGLTFGSAGHLLMFQDSSALGDDTSGNTNDWTSSNLDTHDQMLDTPTFNSSSNGGNYPTYNPLLKPPSNLTLAEGNLKATLTSNNTGIMTNWQVPLTGKWYWEVDMDNIPSGQGIYIGVMPANTDLTINQESNNLGLVYYSINGNSILKGTRSSYGATFTTGDIISIAVDRDADTIQFYKNGSAQGSAIDVSSLDAEFFCYMGCTGGSGPFSAILNFGQDGTFAGNVTAQGNSDDTGYGNFYYAPPTGFLAMCSGNQPLSAQIDPAQNSDDYPQKLFGAYTYVGNNDGDRTVSTDFQTDMAWIKVRSIVDNNYIQDSTRGFGFSKSISTNSTGLEGANGGAPTTTKVDSVSSSNMVVTGADFTYSSATYVAWLWRANGGTTVTNTQGSEDSTVQTDPSGHFSIVKWTGTSDSWGNAITVGHGLNAAPDLIIGKKYLGNADEWQIFFSDYGDYSIGGSNAASNSLVLNNDSALYTNQSYKGYGGVMPTSTVFTVDGNNLNGSGDTVLAYCFANCEGYIKVGTYEGNANADGVFVYTGFEPAFFMCKPLPAGNWRIQDTKRSPYNVANKTLFPNHTNAEQSYSSDRIDILSNGVKMRASDSNYNQATTFVYLAMAHNPFKYSLAR